MTGSDSQGSREAAAVVLAAGKGTRMKSDIPKVATELAGRPLLLHVLDSLIAAGFRRICIIVGYRRDLVEAIVPEYADTRIEFAHQAEQKGTAHAFLCAREALADFQGPVLVACGDMPMIRAQTLTDLLDRHNSEQNSATVLSARLNPPTGYGRLVRNEEGKLISIIEEKDASDEIRRIDEVNTGSYIFEAPEIFELLTRIDTNNAQGEYYLPDAIALYRKQNRNVGSHLLTDAMEAHGVNSRADLDLLEEKLKLRT